MFFWTKAQEDDNISKVNALIPGAYREKVTYN